ncbi:hypothetical protein BDA99DRAFT_499043 [Phascolomyces articulosus]|uniref:Uncharacterized protein n=1 Tax=Phascolomyces articulosus TaxID=60185 RepID=A0AAD5KI26_9FUNG|nr:hypothetical protein BDA99DRAFT_499043 [Phascolomyces articulosus]
MIPTTNHILDSANVLMDEARVLNDCAQRLFSNETSRQGYQKAIDLMLSSLECGGKIVVTGVGKSGKISEKIVATMLSTGTSAVFLHPVEAMHGDLGAVHPDDVVLALSYSGNTEELMRIVPSLNHRGVPIIGLGGNAKSQLAKASAAWIDAYVQREASEIPAPTSSTTLALALGDAIALTLAKQRKFTTHGFALNHPGGSLGRRLLLKVKECMVPAQKVAAVSADASLDVVIMEMTRHPKGGGVVVLQSFSGTKNPNGISTISADIEQEPSPPSSAASTDDTTTIASNEEEDGVDHGPGVSVASTTENSVLGVITHSNIHRILKTAARESVFDIRACDIMTPEPIVCSTEELATDALRMMVEKNPLGKELPLLPVIDGKDKRGTWSGVVTLKDLQELF